MKHISAIPGVDVGKSGCGDADGTSGGGGGNDGGGDGGGSAKEA